MKNIKRLTLIAFLFLAMLALVACSGGNASSGQQGQSGASDDQGGGQLSPQEAGVPDDVPVMDGYRNLDVKSDGSNVAYAVDGDIETVVTFYQEELAKLGWEPTRSPDNVLGTMATLARENANKDRITFSLQYNPMGEFVVVRIVVLRQP